MGSERATMFEDDIWAASLGVADAPDKTQIEVKRLADTGMLRYSAPPSRKIDMGRDVTIDLTDDQYRRFLSDTNSIIRSRIEAVMDEDSWDTWTDKEKSYVIRKMIKKGRTFVRKHLKRSLRIKGE